MIEKHSKLMSVEEVATQWNLSSRRVTQLCSEGRVSGAELIGKVWVIPGDAEKPKDARARSDFSLNADAKPFVKWVGGKGQLLPVINNSLPKGIGDSINNYMSLLQFEWNRRKQTSSII